MSRICCSPFCDARQPGPPLALKTDSMGKPGSSEVTSTVAICPRSIQRGPGPGLATVRPEAISLLRTFLFSLIFLRGRYGWGDRHAAPLVGVPLVSVTGRRGAF